MTMTVTIKLFVSLFYLFVATAVAQQAQAQQQQDAGGAPMSAGKLRSKGEEAFISGQYDDALQHYRDAVELEPQNALNHYKLFRVHQRMRKYSDALKNLGRALELKPDSKDYRLQKVKLLKSLGQCEEALVVVQPLEGQDELTEQVKSCATDIAAAQQMIFKEEWQEAAHFLDRAMKHVEQASDLTFQRAQALYHLGDYYGAISDTGRVLKAHSQHLEAYELRGKAYFRLGDHETATNHYREGLKLDPEHKGCKAGHRFVKSIEKKKKRGDDAYDQGKNEDAIAHWWEAINIDQSHIAFFRPTLLKIVKAHTKLGQHDKAIEEAEKHVNNQETVEGLYALGGAQQGAEKYEEAVRTFQRAMEVAPDDQKQEAQQKAREAEVALKQSKEKNYYKILGIARQANSKEIKKAYREMALKWHPDKNTGDTKEEAEKMFQDISEAYEVLSSDDLRGKYDRGEAVFENQGGGGQQRHNPHQFFNQHFQQRGQQQQQRGGQRFHVKYG
eukprot:CAMPEP_0119012844 /NCGR_PEP_ID=MMETSP1176-20130426/7657_1 /TAXON_ID=265551 /ORGANISM="Synedropsis recta cf, Strain CCMP1620" /LENGTH=500 /DNA_ID=CAMNT_0006965879 /DNA_START=25 /DNA_END=1527 /DNA_ORIENTATION=+